MCSDLNHTALWSESWIRSPKMPRFGTLESIIMAPTGLLGVGLGGDDSSRMIAFPGQIGF